jgi:hypothetical protein
MSPWLLYCQNKRGSSCSCVSGQGIAPCPIYMNSCSLDTCQHCFHQAYKLALLNYAPACKISCT